jgi:hypothetical protein
MFLRHGQLAHPLRATRRTAIASSPARPGATHGIQRGAQKFAMPTPGSSTGYWKARNSPPRALRWLHRTQVQAVERSPSPPHLVPRRARERVGHGGLPEAVRPITACTSPDGTSRRCPRRILAATRRGRVSSAASADAPFEADLQQLLRLHRELHRQLLQHLAAEAVDDEADRVLLRTGRAGGSRRAGPRRCGWWSPRAPPSPSCCGSRCRAPCGRRTGRR